MHHNNSTYFVQFTSRNQHLNVIWKLTPFPIFYVNKDEKYILQFYLLLCTGVILHLSLQGKNMDWEHGADKICGPKWKEIPGEWRKLNGHGSLVCTLNPLNTELNPICYLLALLAHHFLHVSRIMVKPLTLRLLMSYIYGAHILDVSRSHTTTHHSR